MNDEPIVCTPLEALRCFARSGIDLLVLEDFVIERGAVPGFWPTYLPVLHPPVSEDRNPGGHDVYSFF
jgi:carbamoyltransferase